MRITWGTALETGIRSIDLQHEELIGMLNELDDAHGSGKSQTVLDDVLQRLGTYVAFHFATEEALIVGLPHSERHAEEHLRQHGNFIEQLTKMREQAKQDGPQTMRYLIDFLNEWLYEHILKTDRKLAALLHSQAAKVHEQGR